MKVLGIDCGGSHLSCGLIEDKKILAWEDIRTDATSLRQLLPTLADVLRNLCARAGSPLDSCVGVGIGLPVVMDATTGETLSTLEKFRDLPDVDLSRWSMAELGLPARFENDARLALLGEHAAGAAAGAHDVVMITLGTGIGGAAMLQDRLLFSRLGQAGCLGGHLTVNLLGRRCVCGAIGCAEAEASTSVLPEVCREWPSFAGSKLAGVTPLNFDLLFQTADAGDRVANQVLSHCIRVWSALTVSLIHAYGPELILFGGGVMKRGEEILTPLREWVHKHMWTTSRGVPRIEVAALGNHAALFGAEALFSEAYR